ncbi:MAG TPA: Hpt domain-containing protein, partial [Ktedonobacterales bacterium]|nr:Hpt domain-containing protein [Ktedonobacterales bacterium]
MSSSFDKFAILDSFLDEVGSYLPEIEGNLNRLEQTPDDVEALEEAYRRTHTISGSASMMDFPGLSQVAHSMEDVLGDALDEVLRLDTVVIGLLRRSLERVRQSLEVIKTGAPDDGRIVAEDTVDHASFRQQREARSADGAVIQDAIIVTPGASAEADAGADQAEEQAASEAWSSTQAEPATSTAGSSGPADWLSMLQPPDDGAATGDSQGTPLVAQGSQAREPITQPLETFPSAEESALEAEPAAEASEAIIAPQEKFAPSLSEPAPSADGQPSLAEMLAAFRAPADGEWPESQLASADPSPAQASAPAGGAGNQSSPLSTPGSWLDAFRTPPVESTYQAPLSQSYETSEPSAFSQPPDQHSGSAPSSSAASFPPASSLPMSEGDGFSGMLAWQDVIEQETHVRQGAASLKETLAALRVVAKSIEDERSELRGFLDGSKDAIDRLEDWAGKAMGLNLRQSPDHVRRYLPLSVLWVVTTRLKKILGLLKDASSTLAATDGEMNAATAQLGESIRKCGTLISSVLSMAASTQEGGGFSATLAHISWLPPAAPAAPALEDLPLPSRSALERDLRDQIIEQVRREEVARLRQEIEIEVRQQFLAGIAANRVAPAVEPEPWQSGPVMPAAQPAAPPAPAPRQKKVTRATDQSEEALEVFRAEAEEHLQHIGAGVTAMEKAPEDREVLQGIRRATHTLKGAAAMMGFASIADLAHISEDLLDRIMEGSITLNTDVLSLILDTSEGLELLVAGKTADRGGDQAVVDALRPRYRALLSQEGEAESAAGGLGISNFSAIEAEAVEELANRAVQSDEDSGRLAALTKNGSGVDKEDLTVRIRLKKLDELVNLFGELLVNRATLEERLNRLTRMVSDVGLSSTRLQEVGSQLESRFEAATLPAGQMARSLALETTSWAVSATGPTDRSASMSGRPLALPPSALGGSPSSNADHLADFDELELDRYSEFHRLSRGLSEGISDMATLSSEMEALIRECETIFNKENRLSSTFQDQLLKVRLVPLSTMVPRLYRAARAVALRQGKEIELVMEGEETEVDRTVYEEVAGPLLHLVRNSVTHGIESPEAREAASKPRAGQIKLSASYEGNQVVITVRDDGTGIDAERVRGTAIARGLLDARAPLSEQSVLNLIFRPGFSTAESITEESGRGVGLDVVHDVVSRLRGSVEVESTPGNGSAFTMKFPISLQIQRAVLVRADTQTYAIPMAVVEQIGRLDYCEPT